VDVGAIEKIGELQAVFSRHGIRPTYVIDYPVATSSASVDAIKALLDTGQCDIGAHLHPWVTPPFVEQVSGPNSFGCNLGPEIEADKIRALIDRIERSFGVTPRVFKAGRYGFGASTAAVLEDLGFHVDASVNPLMDFSSEAGPSFVKFDAWPFFFGRCRPLLEIPCTLGYTGLARRAGSTIHPIASAPALRSARLPGLMARLRLLNKVMLSPEGSRLDEMRALVETLCAHGLRTFSLTLHSPSIEPGCTPYVRTSADLQDFIARIDGFCRFFFGEMQGVSMSLHEFHDWVSEPNEMRECL
jgi:hypothetical protein